MENSSICGSTPFQTTYSDERYSHNILKISESLFSVSSNPGLSTSTTQRCLSLFFSFTRNRLDIWMSSVHDCKVVPTRRSDLLATFTNYKSSTLNISALHAQRKKYRCFSRTGWAHNPCSNRYISDVRPSGCGETETHKMTTSSSASLVAIRNRND